MKKFFALILSIAFLFTLALPASAAHKHSWDFTITDEEVVVFCYCGSEFVIPTNAKANSCDHVFIEFYNSEGHGKECAECGLITFDVHDWKHSFSNDEHHMYCRNCDYEEYHDAVSYHDDHFHYIECYECGATSEHTMSAYDVGERYHYYECNECDYFIREAHTYNEDGICIECQLFDGFLTDTNILDEGYEVEVFVNDEYFYYETYCDMTSYELNSLVNFTVYDGEIVEISTLLSTSDFEDQEYLEENFEIGQVTQNFMYKFENGKNFNDSDVFLFNITDGYYHVRSNSEILLYKPVNPHLYPIVVPID